MVSLVKGPPSTKESKAFLKVGSRGLFQLLLDFGVFSLEDMVVGFWAFVV